MKVGLLKDIKDGEFRTIMTLMKQQNGISGSRRILENLGQEQGNF